MPETKRKTVSEVSKLAGISVRTLHYYDEIGLLHASNLSESGYRFYDDEDLLRLQQILFLKEMGFELKKIKEMINDAAYDMQKALTKQREILALKKAHIEGLMQLIDRQLKNNKEVDLEMFNTTEIEKVQKQYEDEVKAKWGSTNAYKECEAKTKNYGEERWNEVMKDGDEIFKELSAHRGEEPSSEGVQQLVAKWRNHITHNFYECTLQIFEGLGMMYVEDERFMKNIDKYGEGTAKLLSEGIAFYCIKNS